MAKFKEGDRVIITDDLMDHRIPIGSIVTIDIVTPEDEEIPYGTHPAVNGIDMYAWFNDDECKKAPK